MIGGKRSLGDAWAQWAAASRVSHVPRSALRDKSIISSRLAKRSRGVIAFVVPPMAIVLVFAVWELSARAGAPAGAIVAVSVFVGLLTAGIVWTLTVTTANLGVALSDEGLALFTTRLRFGQVSRRDIRWDELSEPEENSRGGDISVSTTGFPIVLTHE